MRHTLSTRGFTLIEVLIVQVMVVLVSGLLFVLFGQSQYILKRGTASLTMHQTARQALVRVIPLIASSNRRPDDPPQIDSRTVLPDGSAGPGHNLQPVLKPEVPEPDYVRPKVDTPQDTNLNGEPDEDENTEIILRSVDSYVATILRRPPIEPTFNPRDPYRWQPGSPLFGSPYPVDSGVYRIFFKRDMAKTTNTPESPGGRIGTICLDGNTPSDTSDDIVLAHRIYNIQFHYEFRNTVDVVLCVKGHLPKAGGLLASQMSPTAVGENQAEIDKLIRTTRVYLPIETN